MTPLTHDEFLILRDKAELIEADHYGEKVLRLANGDFLKLFRRKRLLSSAALYPYAQRFADNAIALQRLGIKCPQVLNVYRVSAIKRDAVHYLPLPGQTLRQITEVHTKDQLYQQLGRFIAQLHASGVYFRSLHLGNIVLTPDGELGLIDIADMGIERTPLSKKKCLRNFRHLLRTPSDKNWLLENKSNSFFDSYIGHACLEWNVRELTQQLTQG